MKQRRINATLTIAALALTILLILTALPLAGVFPLPASAEPLAQQGGNMEPVGQIGGDTYVASTVIYVPDDYPTIQAAVDAASPGDTIIVRDGTYTENVDVHKDRLTIESENGADSTIVQAANPDGLVFFVTSDSVAIFGFTIRNGKDGIGLSSAFSIVDNCIVEGNVRYGVGMWKSNSTISNSTIKSNDRGGINIWASGNHVIDSVVEDNKEYGIGLFGSENGLVTRSIIKDNTGYGIRICSSTGYLIYLNNFINNTDNVYSSNNSTNIWNSPEELTYAHNGNIYTNHLGSYWSDYIGSDADGDGIGGTPYSIDSDSDNYPLMQPFENYRVTPSTPVGGVIIPVSKLGLLVPWIGLVLLALAVGILLVKKHRL